MKTLLTLEDLAVYSQEDLRNHIITSYEAKPEELEGFTFLIAYESVGSWGCDSSSFFLLEKDGKLYENHGSHCSCYGFEGQWKPEETTIEYLISDKFYLSCGGYDDSSEQNKESVKNYLIELANTNKPIEKPIIMDEEDAYLMQITELKDTLNGLIKEIKPTKNNKELLDKAKKLI
jgi:hypothetical protein